MNVDWLENETIFYLDEDDLKKLLESESVWKSKEEQIPAKMGMTEKRTFSAQLSTSSSTQSSEKYDDCLLALEEAVAFIRTVEQLGMGQQSFRKDYFDLNKVKNTYEHYREMQKKYE